MPGWRERGTWRIAAAKAMALRRGIAFSDASGHGWQKMTSPPQPNVDITSGMTARAQVTAWPDFRALQDSTLAAQFVAGPLSAFETLEWFLNLEQTCPVPQATILLLAASDADGGTLIPLRRRRMGGIESLSNFYGSLFGPVATGMQAAVRHAAVLAQWLHDNGCSTLRLHPLSHDTPFWPRLATALREHGYWVDEYFVFANWYHPCEGVRWSEYLAARPSRLRNTIVRIRKKLAGNADFHWELTDGRTDAEHLAKAIDDFCAVYARSWKKPEPFPAFIPGLCRLAHAQGWLRLGIGYLKDKPVSAQIWLVKSGVASIFKLAYDNEHAKLGVGTWMSAALTEHVLDVDQVREIDFLAGDDSYKAEWMDCRRERFGIVAFQPRSVRGLVTGGMHFGVRHLRRYLSRIFKA